MGVGEVSEVVGQSAVIERLEARQLLATLYAVDYMPLAWGTSWTYLTVENGKRGTERVSATPGAFSFAGDAAERVVSQHSDGSRDTLLLSFPNLTGGAVLRYSEGTKSGGNRSEFNFYPSLTMAPGILKLKEQFTSTARTFYHLPDHISTEGTATYSCTPVRFSQVKVKAGSFRALMLSDVLTYVINYGEKSVTMRTSSTWWAAKGVGMIKSIEKTQARAYVNGRLVTQGWRTVTKELKSYSIPRV